jgi:hypothetical protein
MENEFQKQINLNISSEKSKIANDATFSRKSFRASAAHQV